MARKGLGSGRGYNLSQRLRMSKKRIIEEAILAFACRAEDQKIVDHAGALYREWHPMHGTDVNDAFLAATVLKTGGKLYTLNTRHYPMEDLVVEKAW